MYTARQAGIEAPYRAHDIDALEFVRSVLFEDWCILHRVLVRTWRAIDVARARVPRRGRIRMIIGNLTIADHHMMRQHAADSFIESPADGLAGNFEIRPGL